MQESAIERKLYLDLRSRGAICWKFTGRPGVPDRLVILPGGRVIFVELKTEKGRLSALQRFQIGRMRELGADVRVLYGSEQVDEFIREECPCEI